MSSTSMFPDQVAALQQLLADTNGFALDVAEDTHMSLRVVVFTRQPTDSDPDVEPEDGARCEARWFSVSVAGTVREIAPTPERVAA